MDAPRTSPCATSSGRAVSLHQFRGKVVIVAFNDPQCTTICPLTTTAMVDAKRLLGPAGARSGTARRGRKPAGHRDPLGTGVLGSARDDARMALPQRAASSARGGLARLRDRSAGRPGADRPHPGRVRDRHARRALAPLHDADVLFERRGSSPRSSRRRRRVCCQGIQRCLPCPPTPRSRWSNRPPPSACRAPAAAACGSAPAPNRGCCCSSTPGTPRSRTSRANSIGSTVTRRPRRARDCRRSRRSTRRASSAPPAHCRSSCTGCRTRSPTLWRSIRAAAWPTATGCRTSRISSSISPSGRFLWYHDVSAGGWLTRAGLVS